MSRKVSSRSSFTRSDRVGPLILQIVAEQLQYIDDKRLDGVSITGVDVDNELAKAKVYFDKYETDTDAVADALVAFSEYRGKLRKAVAHQTRIRRAPELDFRPDPAIAAGLRIDEILRGIDDSE
ncbi:MAG: 30S ribosome-binding factor RbfA [Acidimicrobiales bacterium]